MHVVITVVTILCVMRKMHDTQNALVGLSGIPST